MDDQACPRCKTTKYRNPSLKMMVNVCGHTLCESCVDLLFLKGSGACPECKIPLRRTNFRVQMFEDSMVEKEVNIRKRILRDFNKREDDFSTLREYNDYLEDIETIIYNLANNIDVVETNKKIEQYKKDNKEQIAKSKSKLGRSEYELEEMIELEKQKEEEKRKEFVREEMEAKKKKIRDKEALLNELTFSDANAKNIIESFTSVIQKKKEAKASVKVTQFSTGIKFGNQGNQNYLSVPKIEEGPLYSYTSIEQEIEGPSPPGWREIQARGYVSHAVIDANIFPVLIEILSKAEFKTRKEAAWAITNATSGGTADQIRYLAMQGCIPPLCDLLTVMDAKIVQVALNGLENILRLGEQDAPMHNGLNPYAVLIEECYGLDKIEFLQSHQNMDIYQKAFDIIERFFGSEEEDTRLVPSIDSQGQEYQFTAPDSSQLPVQGFEF